MEAVLDNFKYTFDLFARSPVFRYVRRPDNVFYTSDFDHPLFNGCYATRLTSDAERRVDECLGVFRRAKVSAYWWVDPATTPRDLPSLLEAKGLVPQAPVPSMALELKDRPTWTGDKPDLEIRTVKTIPDLFHWSDLFNRIFELPQPLAAAYSESFQAIGLREPGIRFFTAYDDGRAVGVAQATFSGPTVGLWCIGVSPKARRRGAGRLLSEACLEAGEARGCRTAILNSSPMGLPLYTKLGFEVVGEMTRHLFTPAK